MSVKGNRQNILKTIIGMAAVYDEPAEIARALDLPPAQVHRAVRRRMGQLKLKSGHQVNRALQQKESWLEHIRVLRDQHPARREELDPEIGRLIEEIRELKALSRLQPGRQRERDANLMLW